MKRFLFIIPITISLFIICSPNSSFADTHRYGCWIPGTNKVWHTNVPGSTINFQNDGVTGALNGIDDGFYDLDGRCGDATTFCEVFWNVSSYHPAGESRGVGYLADYSIDYCPIDDYVPILSTIIILISFRKIYRRKEDE